MEYRRLFDRLSLKGKKAVVTGGGSGMGASVAAAFAEMGADVALLDINLEGAQRVAATIMNEYGTRMQAYMCDVTNQDNVEAVMEEIYKSFGRIDILFNNAGRSFNCNAEDMELKDWDRIIRLVLTGVFIVAQSAGRYMIHQRSGSIINTASMSGHIVNRPQSQCGYNSAKAGVLQLTKSLAVEWAQYNIRVNSISPGYMDTPMTSHAPRERRNIWINATPMHRMGKAEEVQGAVVYLASDAASFTTGCDIIIDGGFSCI